MRRSLLGVLLALLVINPANAQESGGHLLMDMTLRVAPGEIEGHCLLLEAGTLEVSLQSADDRVGGPVTQPLFAMGPYRTSPAGPGSPPEIAGIAVTAARTTATLPVDGGLYCYSLSTEAAPEVHALPAREQVAHFRFVAITMTLTPQ